MPLAQAGAAGNTDRPWCRHSLRRHNDHCHASACQASARIGRISGHGLASHIRLRDPAWLLYGVVGLLLIANTINLAADVSVSIILTTALTLHLHGVTEIQSSAQAASALRPITGEFAFLMFSAGIIGTGLLAIAVLAGSSACAMAGVFQWRNSLERKPMNARHFYAIIVFSTLIGIGLGFTASMGMFVIKRRLKVLGWLATLMMAAAVVAMLLSL